MTRWLPLLLLLAACNPPTQVLVTVTADAQVESRTRYICVRTWVGLGEGRRSISEPELAPVPEAVPGFPTLIPLWPGPNGAPDETFTFEVSACDGPCEACFVSGGFSAKFLPGARRELTVHLGAECVGVSCELGRTCRDGVCVDEFVDDTATELPLPSDAQPARCAGPRCQEHPRPGAYVLSVCLSGGEAFAGASGGVLRRDGGVWRFEPIEGAGDVNSVACLGGGRVVAGAQRGVLLERDPEGTWTSLSTGAAASARVTHGGAELWATDGVAIHRRDGPGAWSSVPAPPGGVSGKLVISPAGDQVWWVRHDPVDLHRWDGATWSPVAGPVGAEGVLASTFSDGLVLISGDAPDRRLYRWDGATWSEEEVPCGFVGLPALVGLPTGELFGGGGRGSLVYRSADGDWRCFGHLSGAAHRGAALERDAEGLHGLLVTMEGTISAWDGERLRREGAQQFQGDLEDVAALPGRERFVAVGDERGVPLIVERLGDDRWRVRRVDGAAGLTRVAADAREAIAVGERGVLHLRDYTDGLGWRRAPIEPDVRLDRIATRAGHWAGSGGATREDGGSDPVVLRRDGDTWRRVSAPPIGDASISALTIGPGGELWIGTTPGGDDACAGGAVLREAGGAWATVIDVPCAVTDLHVDDDRAAWIVAGALYRVNEGGAAETRALEGFDRELRRVWRVDGEVRAAWATSGQFWIRRGSGITTMPGYFGARAFAADGPLAITAGRRRIDRFSLE